MSVTQRELAKILNVSQMTVSRALRGREGVDPKLRQNILGIAQKMGYSQESNYAAKLLRQRALGVVPMTGVYCAMLYDEGDEQSFHGRIIRGVYDGAREVGVEVVLASRSGGSGGDLPLMISRGQVDGVVRMLTATDVAEGYPQCPIPWVSILFDLPRTDVVTVDNARGMEEVGRYLGALGHRQVAYIGGQSMLSQQRLAGLRSGLAQAGGGVPEHLVALDRWAGGDERTVVSLEQLLGVNRKADTLPFSALACYNDYMAMAAVGHLQGLGLRVPQDISVVGFDGAVPRYYHGRSLTTAAQPLEELGAEAIRLLSWRLQNPKAARRRLVLATKLVQGETAAAAR